MALSAAARFPKRGYGSAEQDVRASVRSLLRNATAAGHERMHEHPGFHAAASGVISAADYRRLLARLVSFHRPFEGLIRGARERHGVDLDLDVRARSPSLVLDLATLGLSRPAIDGLPNWSPSLDLASEGALLGSLYVLEGSTLGGLQIAQALKVRFGGSDGDGRRFFLGRGESHKVLWGGFLSRLEKLAGDDRLCDAAIAASVATFGAFEQWMEGWAAEPDA